MEYHAANRGAPRIFLSYGQRDAGTLAAAVCRDLVEHGYEVFRDADSIHAGLAWSEEIRSGIKSSHVFLALLSPHAVRRAGLPGNPDNKDSVCLDEIAYPTRPSSHRDPEHGPGRRFGARGDEIERAQDAQCVRPL